MAVVAFPFTCFTSEDIDDVDTLQPYATSTDEVLEVRRPSLNDDCAALAPRNGDCDSGTEDLLGTGCRTDSDVIDGQSDEESAETRVDDQDKNVVQNAKELPLELGTQTRDIEAYGGLTNLGNTCFMNAALQMVASLDRFPEELENTPASKFHQPKLRSAFLGIMASLRAGETVTPNEFKKALDERTSLFLGYHQEDSHEFLTTLLDLLDADYRVTANETSGCDGEATAVKEEDDEVDKDDKPTEFKSDGDDQAMPIAEAEQNCEVEEKDGHTKSEDSSPSGAETVEGSEQELLERQLHESEAYKLQKNAGECLPVTPEETQQLAEKALGSAVSHGSCASFSELKPDGIEELLNARLLVDSVQEMITARTPPRCKLAGGRMASTANNATALICEPGAHTGTSSKGVSMEEDEGAVGTQKSPVDKYFQTEVQVRLTCESCKYTRTHRENFLHLSLEIGADSDAAAVEDGVRKFFSPERREIKCEKCFCASALQTMEITRLPVALLLHLKRFIVDVSDDYSSITYRKNQSDVLFDEKLDLEGVLSEFWSCDVSFPEGYSPLRCQQGDIKYCYKIRSVVNHMGASAACGHYTADSLRAYPGGCRRWNRFNDSHVTNISFHEAIRGSTGTAYMVMYELSSS